MTLDPATLGFTEAQTGPARGVGTLRWTLPNGAVQNGVAVEIFRAEDIPFEGGGATHTPVGGTRRNNVPYADRPVRAVWYFGSARRFLTLNRRWPSEDFLGNGNYVVRMWWRGSQPGVLGSDQFSRVAELDITMSLSPYPAIRPIMLRRQRLETATGEVRIDVFPAPAFHHPTQWEVIDLSAEDMYFEFDIPKNVPARYFKLGIHPEKDVLDPNNKKRRPGFFTDDGVGTAIFAEWVLLSLAAVKVTGAADGFQRYRCTFSEGNLVNQRVSTGRWTAFVRYADAREGDYRSSENTYVSFQASNSPAPAPIIRDIIYDPPVFLTKPVVTPSSPNPIFVEQDEPWVLAFNYISNSGLRQKEINVAYEADQAKATALSGHRVSGLLWTEDQGVATFDSFQPAIANSDVTVQALPVPAHPSDAITRNPNSRIGKTDTYPGNLERRYYDFHIQARDRNDAWSDLTDGQSGRPPPVRVYLYRRLRASRLSAQVVGLPLNQREPTFSSARPTNGYISLSIDVAHDTLTHQQDTGNWPDDIKVAWYRQQDIQGGLPTARPFAYTSDYRVRPNAPNQSVEHAASTTGAEWVPTSARLSSATGNNLFEAVRDDGEYPLRWGEYISEGGNPDTYTYGEIPNGTHTVRVDVRDVHGSRATRTLSQNVTVNLPAVQDVTATPRVHDRNGQEILDADGNAITTGLVQGGAYIRLSFTETTDAAKGLASFLIIERREVDDRGLVVQTIAEDGRIIENITFPFRVTPDQDGNFPPYNDYFVRPNRRYQYRIRAVRLPGITATSVWTPT